MTVSEYLISLSPRNTTFTISFPPRRDTIDIILYGVQGGMLVHIDPTCHSKLPRYPGTLSAEDLSLLSPNSCTSSDSLPLDQGTRCLTFCLPVCWGSSMFLLQDLLVYLPSTHLVPTPTQVMRQLALHSYRCVCMCLYYARRRPHFRTLIHHSWVYSLQIRSRWGEMQTPQTDRQTVKVGR